MVRWVPVGVATDHRKVMPVLAGPLCLSRSTGEAALS